MPSRVYIGNISRSCREKDVERFFKGYGRLREVALKSGYGFVQFEDTRDADDACHDLDGKELAGERVRVEMARERRGRSPRGRSPGRDRDRRDDRREGGSGGIRKGIPPGRKTNYRLIVENMSSKTSWQDLKDYFRTCGEITFTNAHKPRQGEGLVEFGDRRAMEYALDKLDDTELDGKRIRLTEEGAGGSRKRSYSRSRSPRSRSPRSRSPRSRSRSRSRSRGADARGRSSSRD